MPVIDTVDDLRSALVDLQGIDERFSRVLETVGEPPLRRVSDGFESLVDIIVAQQVSRASADAISTRMRANLRPYTWQGFQGFSDETYVAQGLSRPKIKTLRALSNAVGNNQLDFAGLRDLSDGKATEALTRIKGIGPWTAEIYLLTCLGRVDVWPAGDIALQVGVQMICQLDKRPSAQECHEIASEWQPLRSIAARLIWSYYAHQKTNGTKINRPNP